jgi:hypothetical protein
MAGHVDQLNAQRCAVQLEAGQVRVAVELSEFRPDPWILTAPARAGCRSISPISSSRARFLCFTEADRDGTLPVAVVSRSMARALWPDPPGRCIQLFFGPEPLAPCTTVIGIAEDAAQQNLTDDPGFMYYLPLDQVDHSWGSQLFLRMAGPDAGGSVERVRLALNRAMPGQGYVSVQPMEDLLDRQRSVPPSSWGSASWHSWWPRWVSTGP